MQDINLAVCGHVDHGKSTLLGKTLVELKMVTSKKLEESLEMVRNHSDASYVFANLMYRSKGTTAQSEAKRGMTMQPALIRFSFPPQELRVTCIDTPGHTRFTNNLFAGLFQADVALVLVAAGDGVSPSTLQVLKILRGFQIPVVGVSITKMDLVDFSEDIYQTRVQEVTKCLKHFGLYNDSIRFFPTSAYAPGRDIRSPAEGILRYDQINWFEEPTFTTFMRDLDVDKDRLKHSFRGLVHPNDMYDHVPGIGKAMTCVVEYGEIKRQDRFVMEPVSAIAKRPITARAVNLELTRGHMATPGVEIQVAKPRQLIGINVDLDNDKRGLREICDGRGIVIGLERNPPATATDMILEMTAFDETLKVRRDEVWTMHVHVDRVPIKILEVLQHSIGPQRGKHSEITANSASGPDSESESELPKPKTVKNSKEHDQFHDSVPAKSEHIDLDRHSEWFEPDEKTEIEIGDWVRIHVRAHSPVAIEESKSLPQLSRFVVRKKLEAAGYGYCMKILDEGDDPREVLNLPPKSKNKDKADADTCSDPAPSEPSDE